MKPSHVWIVEMKADGESCYTPTVGCKLTRADALIELREWRGKNPDDRFRIRKYRA